MNRIALFTAVAVLAGGVAFAQHDLGNNPVAGASYTTGVVELYDASAIAVREDTGRVVTILLDKATVNADHASVGSRVKVNFHKNDQGRAVADEIQGLKIEPPPQVAAAPTPAPAYTPPPAPAPAYVPQEKAAAPAAVAPAPAQAAPLPKAGSPLATIGLLGLLALGTGFAVRFIR